MEKKPNTYDEALLDWIVSNNKSPARPVSNIDDAIFRSKKAKHMLIGKERNKPFDDDAYFFEPALGGLRSFAYLSPNECSIIGRRGANMLTWFPEFLTMNTQVKSRCILDGEIVSFKNGMPDCKEYAYRATLGSQALIVRASHHAPAVFVASDIVFSDEGAITDLPLFQRKQVLHDIIIEDSTIMATKHLRGEGNSLYTAVHQRGIEGIIAKHKNSCYHFGIKSPDWTAIKSFLHDNFIICGYSETEGRRLILGQYDPIGVILYRGSVTLGVRDRDFDMARQQKKTPHHPFSHLPPNAVPGASWIEPALVCSVSFTARNEKGLLYNPAYRGLKFDMSWDETVMQDALAGCQADPDMSGWIMGPWT